MTADELLKKFALSVRLKAKKNTFSPIVLSIKFLNTDSHSKILMLSVFAIQLVMYLGDGSTEKAKHIDSFHAFLKHLE